MDSNFGLSGTNHPMSSYPLPIITIETFNFIFLKEWFLF